MHVPPSCSANSSRVVFQTYCEPQNYLPMNHPHYAGELEKYAAINIVKILMGKI